MRAETFGYLPPMSPDQVAAQVRWLLGRGLIPGVEYTDAPGPGNRYWSMWKLPLFDAATPEEVVAEVDACASEHPQAWVRVVGYDRTRGGLASAFVVAGREGTR